MIRKKITTADRADAVGREKDSRRVGIATKYAVHTAQGPVSMKRPLCPYQQTTTAYKAAATEPRDQLPLRRQTRHDVTPRPAKIYGP